jgi:hypothetical protein
MKMVMYRFHNYSSRFLWSGCKIRRHHVRSRCEILFPAFNIGPSATTRMSVKTLNVSYASTLLLWCRFSDRFFAVGNRINRAYGKFPLGTSFRYHIALPQTYSYVLGPIISEIWTLCKIINVVLVYFNLFANKTILKYKNKWLIKIQ